MKRTAIAQLTAWKTSTNRKPLVIRGARQVGKTWLMKEFGKTEFNNFIYINFDSNPDMANLFDGSLQIPRLIAGLQIYSGQKITKDTLLIFDEIQEVPRALSSLKYFCEDDPEHAVIAAGSLLGVAMHKGTSFSVGKVDFMDLYPLSFTEFLNATGNENLVDLLLSGDWQLITAFKNKYIELLRYYYFIGGMPEAVQTFVDENDLNAVRKVQLNILNAYEQDFSKHAPFETVPRIRMVWQSIPSIM